MGESLKPPKIVNQSTRWPLAVFVFFDDDPYTGMFPAQMFFLAPGGSARIAFCAQPGLDVQTRLVTDAPGPVQEFLRECVRAAGVSDFSHRKYGRGL